MSLTDTACRNACCPEDKPLKMTVGQREKLARLGGASWVRDRIDKAKEPAE